MKQTVYVDVLLAVNFFINYFLILSSGKIMHREISRTRVCLSASFGAVTALSIFLPRMGMLTEGIFKLAVSAIMVLIAFKWQSLRVFGRYFLVMCAVTFGFGGTMFALWIMIAPSGMYFRNGVTYFNVSPEFIVVVTILCYTVITVAGKICCSRERHAKRYNITICSNGRATALQVVGDTGNMLSEPFSGYPVIVVKRNSIRRILPQNFEEFTSNSAGLSSLSCLPNCRIIPYSSVGGSGILTAFLPDKIKVTQDGASRELDKCYIAVSDGLECEEYDGIVNPSIFDD